jgi:hypothetical protein
MMEPLQPTPNQMGATIASMEFEDGKHNCFFIFSPNYSNFIVNSTIYFLGNHQK